MNSTSRFHAKPKNEHASPFESRLPPDLASPSSASSNARRIARRWAAPVSTEAGDSSPPRDVDGDGRQTRDGVEKEGHPIEAIVEGLYEPRDMSQRVQEYEWYTHYHADDLSHTLGEEKDLQLYIRAGKLAEGQDVDQLISHETLGWTIPDAGGEANKADAIRANNLAFYDTWLRA